MTSGEPPDLCVHGCYWECEHRASRAAAAERMHLRPVDEATGFPLRRCDECADFFYDPAQHTLEHEALPHRR